MLLHLRFSKTDQTGKGVVIKVFGTDTQLCPLKHMSEYLRIRPNKNGPLFCHFHGCPLSRYQFTGVLKKTLHHLDIDYTKFKSHSFRISAATTAAAMGYSVENIKT